MNGNAEAVSARQIDPICASPLASVLRQKFNCLFLPVYWVVCSELGEVVGEGAQDLVGSFGPGERPGVGVPGGDPVLDVVLQGLHGGMDARRISLSVSRPNHRSTWFIQDEPVGVKWTWKRGWRASQVLISAVLWVT
jgi:hypothetical protein